MTNQGLEIRNCGSPGRYQFMEIDAKNRCGLISGKVINSAGLTDYLIGLAVRRGYYRTAATGTRFVPFNSASISAIFRFAK